MIDISAIISPVQQTPTMTLRIALNGSMLDEHPTGVGVYCYQVINQLTRLYKKADSNTELVVYAPTNANLKLDKKTKLVRLSPMLQSSRFGKVAAASRLFWNIFQYGPATRNCNLLVNLTTHGSIYAKNQILTIHDLLSLRFGKISLHQRLYFKVLLPMMARNAKTILTVSEASKKDIVNYLGCMPEKVKVVYNGYDTEVYTPIGKAFGQICKRYGIGKYILAVGPTYPHKNFELLMATYSLLPEEIKQAYPLVILGGLPKYVGKLKKIAVDQDLSNQVKFMGYVAKEDMPHFYREALFLVYPSLHEGFGMPLLEAMACGCPVLCSNTSSLPEVCGDAAIYFDPFDQNSLLAKMQDLVTNESVRMQLRASGIDRATNFSWEQTAMKIKAIIDLQTKTIN